MKTKIAFNDIPNVIERDEMKQVLGGNVSSVYKEDSTVVSGRTDLLSGGSVGTWYASVGDKGFMGSGSSYNITDPNQIRQIMSVLTGNTYNYNSTSYDTQPLPSDCFFQCLGWISSMFGDSTHDAKYFEKIYGFTNPVSGDEVLYNFLTGTRKGIEPNDVMSFTSMFFNITDASGASPANLAAYVNPIKNPNWNNQLIGIYETASGGLHSVIITEIIGNTIFYYDRQTGNMGSKDSSNFKSYYKITKKN